GLKEGATLPFHFEIVLNPYRPRVRERGAFVRVLYQRPAPATLPPAHFSEGQLIRSEDLVSIVGFFSDAAPAAISPLLQSELEESLKETPPEGILGTHSQQFG